jgi:hypothetical protein
MPVYQCKRNGDSPYTASLKLICPGPQSLVCLPNEICGPSQPLLRGAGKTCASPFITPWDKGLLGIFLSPVRNQPRQNARSDALSAPLDSRRYEANAVVRELGKFLLPAPHDLSPMGHISVLHFTHTTC